MKTIQEQLLDVEQEIPLECTISTEHACKHLSSAIGGIQDTEQALHDIDIAVKIMKAISLEDKIKVVE